jgi:hypothetical protein
MFKSLALQKTCRKNMEKPEVFSTSGGVPHGFFDGKTRGFPPQEAPWIF